APGHDYRPDRCPGNHPRADVRGNGHNRCRCARCGALSQACALAVTPCRKCFDTLGSLSSHRGGRCTMSTRRCGVVILVLCAWAEARAGMVDWDIDPAASFIRLNIPESVLDVIGNDVTLRFRDAGNN